MDTVSYPLRIPKTLLALAKLKASDQYVDQSTALRQLLYLGAEDYLLSLVESGRISIGRAAELLDLPIQDIYRVAEKHGLHLGAAAEEQAESEKTAANLFKKTRRRGPSSRHR